jgi:hypothetical protein
MVLPESFPGLCTPPDIDGSYKKEVDPCREIV